MTPGRRAVLPAMIALLAAYAALHAPVRALRQIAILAREEGCLVGCGGPERILTWAGFTSAAAVAAITLAVAAGLLLARRVPGPGYERWIVAGILSYGLLAVPAAWLGGAGLWLGTHPLRPPTGPLLVALPAVLAILAAARLPRPGGRERRRERLGPLPLAVTGLALLLLAWSAAIALGHPPTGFDALAYHAPLGVLFWREGTIAADLLAGAGPAYAHPGSAELWFGLLRVAAGERLANLGQLPFALLGGIATAAFARRTGLGPGAALLGGAAYLLAPMVLVQGGMQLNDVAAAGMLLAAAALAAAPGGEWDRTRCLLVGLALGLALATKLSMLPGVIAVGGYALLRERRWPATLALGLFLAVAPWWGRNAALFGNPIYPAAIPLVGRGFVTAADGEKDHRFVPARAAWPLYPLLEPHSEQSGFGALFVVAAVPGLMVLGASRRRRLVAPATLAAVTLPAWWALTQHEPRFLLPLIGLGLGCCGWALAAVPRRRRGLAAATVAAAALLSGLVTAARGLRPLAAAPSERVAYYDQVWGIDPATWELPQDQPLAYQMGYAPLSYAGDYPLMGASAGRRLVPVDPGTSPDNVVRLLRARGARLVYVPAAPAALAGLRAVYPPARFELLGSSVAAKGTAEGTRRTIFRLREDAR